VVVHAYNPSSWEAEDCKIQVYRARLRKNQQHRNTFPGTTDERLILNSPEKAAKNGA
jgi:hypothetical protein